MTRIIVLPDDWQEYTAVPKVATDEMLRAGCSELPRTRSVYAAMLAAAPACKVVELPEQALTELYYALRNSLDEIERRAKAHG